MRAERKRAPSSSPLGSLQDAGNLRELVQRDIQSREEPLLSRLPPGDRAAFLRALQTLAALPPTEIRQGEDLGAPGQT